MGKKAREAEREEENRKAAIKRERHLPVAVAVEYRAS